VIFVVFLGGGGRGRGIDVRERVLIRGLSGIRVRVGGAEKVAPCWDLLVAGPGGWAGSTTEGAMAEKGGSGTGGMGGRTGVVLFVVCRALGERIVHGLC